MLSVVSIGLRASGLGNGSAQTMLYLVVAAAKLLLLHQEKFGLADYGSADAPSVPYPPKRHVDHADHAARVVLKPHSTQIACEAALDQARAKATARVGRWIRGPSRSLQTSLRRLSDWLCHVRSTRPATFERAPFREETFWPCAKPTRRREKLRE